ncbi:hypothetical protein N7493_011118 [Penicillium malachiteum]|uniref:Annexin ANXC4 n=1 Tax=Penicillium malachiteum TaxID=1324776 RepID=A0AAD6HBJ3_9EURO|nr:hypothetical protein N7493_011118 [Penicillium malachiteum]
MSLQVNDPRSRSKSPGRHERSRSRSRDSRIDVSDPRLSSTLSPSSGRPRSRSPAVVEIGRSTSPNRNRYDSDNEAKIERQYRLIKETRARERESRREAEDRDPRASVTRVPRSPARYDVRDNGRDRDRYDVSGDERDMKVIQSREYSARSSLQQLPPPSPSGAGSRNGYGHRRNHSRRDSSSSSDDSVDDDLAYGDNHGSHPSYARPDSFRYSASKLFSSKKPAPAPAPAPAPRPSSQIDWASVPECERPGFVPPTSQAGAMPGAFPTSTYADVPSAMAPVQPAEYPASTGAYPTSTGAYAPSHYRTASASDGYHGPQNGYANPAPYQYAQIDPNVRYTSKTAAKPDPYGRQSNLDLHTKQPEQPAQPYRYNYEPKAEKPPPSPRMQSQLQPQPQQFVEITPGGRKTRPHSLSVSSANNLAVTGGASLAGHHPPASPLLEPYHGTYQSMSPMPSPIVIPSIRDDDISDLEPLDGETSGSDTRRRKTHSRTKSSTSERDRDRESTPRSSKEKLRIERGSDREDRRRSRTPIGHGRHESTSSLTAGDSSYVIRSPTSGHKRVSFYDAESDAAAMQSALNHTRNIDNKVIIKVLPGLSNDEILLLRQEYKNRVKVHGKGINLAKHLRLKLGTSSFGKVAYATALGRWESEAYWANCYYQAGTSRRELLIESLIGRSNAAIREIKASFRDSRYENSLEKCMRAELKADKFRVAVLLALEERRQDDREPLDPRLIRLDLEDLHRALISREGGETAMINIIVLRSDTHLREVLRAYEKYYGQNFAKAMIAKSRNLVGETLAHILNGAINRPMRDALLLHQALRESKAGRERTELLISRLVRLHWEPRHFEQVKIDYRRRYGERIEEAIAEEFMASSNGAELGEFCIELVHSSG